MGGWGGWLRECGEGREVVSVDHWNVESLDGIIKQQRVRDYRIHFQVHIYITFQYLTFHTYCTHTSHTHTLTHHTLTHSQGSHAICNLPPTRRICAPKCQIWDRPKVSKKMYNEKTFILGNPHYALE